MATVGRVLLVSLMLAAPAVQALEQRSTAEFRANPIRRVVNMLEAMQKKIAAEAERDEAIHKKFMCYCKTGGETLAASIDAADTKLPKTEAALKEGTSTLAQLKIDLKDHQTSRDDAKASMSKATTIREKEAKEFASADSEYSTNIEALTGAVGAVEKGMAGAFLQTPSAKKVANLAINAKDLTDFDRQTLVSFLTNEEQYAPQSGGISGILKQLKDTMVKDLADMTAAEESAKATFGELMAAKTKEVEANTKAIEEKNVRVGDLSVKIAEMKIDLEDTAEQLEEDKKFLADMEKNCATKEAEWDEICKMRGEEQVAIADTIKILNDDDALEMFKKTLPSPSFIQMVATSSQLRRSALTMVQQARMSIKRTERTPLDLIALALGSKKVSFDKVLKMVDDLVATLGVEQKDDDAKKEYCEKQFDLTEDKKKGLMQDEKDMTAAIEDMTESIETLTDEIKALAADIKALDKEVAEASETRKEENAEHTTLMANNNAAKEIIGFAKNRMQKFYNPKLYVPPPETELAFAEVNLHSYGTEDAAPPPPPESVKAYAKKGEESGGVIAMMDTLIADLDKEMTEAEVEEKNAQEEYETLMTDSADKRALDAKSLTEKENAKSDTEVELQKTKEAKDGKVKELMATEQVIMDLHGECDWILKNYDLRKSAREGEVESLKKAKAVLSGADFSLVQQMRSVTRLQR